MIGFSVIKDLICTFFHMTWSLNENQLHIYNALQVNQVHDIFLQLVMYTVRELAYSRKMLTLLFYFLIYNHLQTANGNGFTVDLLHRHSSNSLKDPFRRLFDTTAVPNGGDYLIKLSVGTPPVDLTAVVSTGTDLTWFQCNPCNSCYQQTGPIFNPASSNTYKNLPCDSRDCSNLDRWHLSCDQKYNECRYWYTYRNGSTMTRGVMGSDAFSFVSSDGKRVFLPPPAFGCGFEQHGLFEQAASGILGLGGGPLSVVSQVGPAIGYKFSYCLASIASHYTSKLRFGSRVETGQAEVKGTFSTPYLTKYPPSFYYLNLTGISIGKMSLQVERDIIIDIGTTLTYLNPSVFSSLEGMVNEAIGVKPVKSTGQFLCYDMKASVITPPDIVFRFCGGDLILKGDNVFFESSGVLCMSIVMSERDGDPMVFGNMAQVNLEVEYDLLAKMVTFSPKDCAHEGTLE